MAQFRLGIDYLSTCYQLDSGTGPIWDRGELVSRKKERGKRTCPSFVDSWLWRYPISSDQLSRYFLTATMKRSASAPSMMRWS